MLFDFHLRPLEEVEPWGTSPDLSLSWFSFTEGFYRLKIGSTYLFSYSDKHVEYWAEQFPHCYAGPYIDYYVVRLWEDLLDILPNILEPLPTELSRLFEAKETAWFEWNNTAIEWLDSQPDEKQAIAVYDSVTTWQNNRRLRGTYLKHTPDLWIWSNDKFVFFSWDDRGARIEGIPVWAAGRGHYAINREVFLQEIHHFHQRLIREMATRVGIICQGAMNPDIHIDINHLKAEQTDRRTWLSSALNRTSSTDWRTVMSAISLQKENTKS